MRFDVMALPQSTDRGLAQSLAGRHQPATPMTDSFRLGLQGRVNDCFDAVRSVDRFASATGRDLPQTVQPFLGETLAPQANGLPIDLQIRGDRRFRFPTGS